MCHSKVVHLLWHKRFVVKCKQVRLQVLSAHLAVLSLIFPHCLCIKSLDRNCFSGEFILVLYWVPFLSGVVGALPRQAPWKVYTR